MFSPTSWVAAALAVAVVAFPSVSAAAGIAEAAIPPAPDAQSLAVSALAYLEKGDEAAIGEAQLTEYRRGLELAQKAVALDESNADAQFALFATEGRIVLSDGPLPNPIQLYEARARLDKVLEIDPHHANALAAKGGLYRQLPWALGGDLDKAESYLTRAIEADPEAIGARIELAATYRDKGQTERCRPLLNEAVAIAEGQGKQRRVREANQLLAELSEQ
jgi:tetratricopeptide (TPR) repeat protein